MLCEPPWVISCHRYRWSSVQFFPRTQLTRLLCCSALGDSTCNSPFSYIPCGQEPVLLCWAGNTCTTIPPAALPSPDSQDNPPELSAVTVAHLSSSTNWWRSGSPQGQSEPSTKASPQWEVSPCEKGRKGLLHVQEEWTLLIPWSHQPFEATLGYRQGHLLRAMEETEDSWLLGNSFFPLFQVFLRAFD